MNFNAPVEIKPCDIARQSITRRQLLAVAAIAGFAQATRAEGNPLGAIYQVGRDKRFHAFADLPTLKPGDIVELHDAVIHEVVNLRASGTATHPIVVRGVGQKRPLIDGEGLNCSGEGKIPRAVIQISGSHVHLENLELRNGRNKTWNGAGVRITGSSNNSISRCRIIDCDMGIMSDGNDLLTIDSCEIAHNGNRRHFNGYSHNLYLEGFRTRVQYCWIHDAFTGINFKSRGRYTELFYNWIARSNEGEVSIVDGAHTSLPYSNAVLLGNVIISKPDRTGNTAKFIDFGQDMGRERNGTIYLLHNTLIAGDGRIRFIHVGDTHSAATADANIFYGSPNIAAPSVGAVNGTHNWLPTGSAPPGFAHSVTSSAPGFVAPQAGDYHLAAGSPCLDVAYSGTYQDAMGVPRGGALSREYSAPCSSVVLPEVGTFAGAFGLHR